MVTNLPCWFLGLDSGVPKKPLEWFIILGMLHSSIVSTFAEPLSSAMICTIHVYLTCFPYRQGTRTPCSCCIVYSTPMSDATPCPSASSFHQAHYSQPVPTLLLTISLMFFPQSQQSPPNTVSCSHFSCSFRSSLILLFLSNSIWKAPRGKPRGCVALDPGAFEVGVVVTRPAKGFVGPTGTGTLAPKPA
jgi:hypothetical protein